jgi:hypothetical protein
VPQLPHRSHVICAFDRLALSRFGKKAYWREPVFLGMPFSWRVCHRDPRICDIYSRAVTHHASWRKRGAISGVGHEKCVTCVTLRALSGIFFLYISYEGLLWKRGTMCHSAMSGIYSIREPGPGTREGKHLAIAPGTPSDNNSQKGAG